MPHGNEQGTGIVNQPLMPAPFGEVMGPSLNEPHAEIPVYVKVTVRVPTSYYAYEPRSLRAELARTRIVAEEWITARLVSALISLLELRHWNGYAVTGVRVLYGVEDIRGDRVIRAVAHEEETDGPLGS